MSYYGNTINEYNFIDIELDSIFLEFNLQDSIDTIKKAIKMH